MAELHTQTRQIHASPALLDYLQDLLEASRREHVTGLSPRAGLALLHAAQASALMQGRAMILPEDVQTVAIPVMAHRLEAGTPTGEMSGPELVQHLLETTAVSYRGAVQDPARAAAGPALAGVRRNGTARPNLNLEPER